VGALIRGVVFIGSGFC